MTTEREPYMAVYAPTIDENKTFSVIEHPEGVRFEVQTKGGATLGVTLPFGFVAHMLVDLGGVLDGRMTEARAEYPAELDRIIEGRATIPPVQGEPGERR